MQPFCSEHRGIHTSLYSSLPQEAVQFLEKAIWFKMVGRTDDARAIFGDELKRFERTAVVAIEHAEQQNWSSRQADGDEHGGFLIPD